MVMAHLMLQPGPALVSIPGPAENTCSFAPARSGADCIRGSLLGIVSVVYAQVAAWSRGRMRVGGLVEVVSGGRWSDVLVKNKIKFPGAHLGIVRAGM